MSAEQRHTGLPPDVFADYQVGLLPPSIIYDGIDQLISDRIEPLYTAPLNDEQEWYMLSHVAVMDLVERSINPYTENQVTQPKEVVRTLRYMRFLGYTTEQTSKQGIASAAAAFMRRPKEPFHEDPVAARVALFTKVAGIDPSQAGVINFQAKQFEKKLRQGAGGEIAIGDIELIISPEMLRYVEDEMKSFFQEQRAIMDELIQHFDQLPSYEAYLAWRADRLI